MSIESTIMFWSSVFYLFIMVVDFITKGDELEHFIRPYYIGAMLAAYIIKFA